MAKIKIGATHDKATTDVRVNIGQESRLSLKVGDAYHMSARQVEIIERDAPEIRRLIEALRKAAVALGRRNPSSEAALEALCIAEKAEQIEKRHRWYEISLHGLVGLSKNVGEAATPIIGAATKIVELLRLIHGA